MSYEQMLAQQFVAFHSAIIDSCDRSNRPQQTDAMALRLRNNALAMTKLQMTLLPHVRDADARPRCNADPLPKARHAPEPAPVPESEPASWAEPEGWPEPEVPSRPEGLEHPASAVGPCQDHILSGDALSRFVSRRLDPAESAYQAWQHSLREAAGGVRRDATQLRGG